MKIAKVPEQKPIIIGHYTLTEKGLRVRGRPNQGEHEAVGEFVRRAHHASGFWLADWIAYGDSREDWKAEIDALVDADVCTEGTARQYRYLAKAVPEENRVEGVSFGHHAIVAALPKDQQRDWLERAKLEGWTVSELRKGIRAAARTKVIDGQAVLEGMYRVLYADPPWHYNDSGATHDGSLGKAERHYTTLTIEDLCKLPVAAHALPDAVLFLWVTSPMLPEAFAVITAWGFTYKTGMVWDKVLGNWGHYVRVHHEHLLIATRGSCLPDVPTPMPDSVQTIRRGDEHSAKPEDFRSIITTLYTRGPYLELFGRQRVEGWDVFGNDARLWAEEASA